MIVTAIELRINGASRKVDAEPETSLLEVLRNDLGLTGTKYGCGESQCGACTVLLNGEATHSCVTPLSEAVGKEIRTIEGLAESGKLHPVQQAFIDEGAMQCGYCVPGMIMRAVALLERTPNPTDAEIVRFMNANVCRCGGYPKMLDAIKRAGKNMGAGK